MFTRHHRSYKKNQSIVPKFFVYQLFAVQVYNISLLIYACVEPTEADEGRYT